jgi:hypothetical protein
VANKRHKQTRGHLTVKVRYVAVPGAEARLAQAIDLLLKAAVINDPKALKAPDSKVKNLSAHDVESRPGEWIVKDKG